MKVKGKYSESEILHAIILIAAAVIAVVVFIIVLFATGGGLGMPSDDKAKASESAAETEPVSTEPEGFVPDEELANEIMDAASELIQNNFEVLCLYYIEGMPHKDEPYGNRPEDGYYTVISDKYHVIEELDALVDSTYTAATADKVKNDPLSYGAIYKMRPNGSLGIIENYTPYSPYNIDWNSPIFVPHPVSETECDLEITVHDKTDGSEVKLEGKMIKTDDGWRFDSVIL